MSSIPEEIYLEIFFKVPVKCLLACKCVCKTWFCIISNPDFVKMQLNLTIKRNNPNLMLQGFDRYRNVFHTIGHDSLESLLSVNRFLDYVVELDFPFKSLGYSVTFIGCCDGLVCLWFWGRQFFCLWNPATREYKRLPEPNADNVSTVAFGCDYKSNNYKLLVGSKSETAAESLFEVCSLGINSWRRIENVPYEFHGSQKSGVLVNGDLHWLADNLQNSSYVLVSLDISKEIFKELELPETLENGYFTNLGVLEGCLCLLEDLNNHVKIWVMPDYGVLESWTNRYIVNIDDVDLRIIWSFKSGQILFGDDFHPNLYVYDPESGSVKELNISNFMCFKEALCFKSLVSLKSGNREEQIEEPNNKKKRRNRIKKNKKKVKKRA